MKTVRTWSIAFVVALALLYLGYTLGRSDGRQAASRAWAPRVADALSGAAPTPWVQSPWAPTLRGPAQEYLIYNNFTSVSAPRLTVSSDASQVDLHDADITVCVHQGEKFQCATAGRIGELLGVPR